MRIQILIFTLFLNEMHFVKSSKILLVFTSIGRSHSIQGRALGKGLAKAGHEVTMLTSFPDTSGDELKGYTEILLNGLLKGVDFSDAKEWNPFTGLPGFIYFFDNYTKNTLEHSKFQLFLKSKRHFDVIIMDVYCFSLKALTCNFNAPLILYNPAAPFIYITEPAGNPYPPSYLPNVWTESSSSMTFWERSLNSAIVVLETTFYHFLACPLQENIVRDYFPNCPYSNQIDQNISLFLTNNHESFNIPYPMVPNVINIQGFHLKDKHSLPEDLQTFMDGSKNGVILFSFGSFLHPSQMEADDKKSFIKSLGKLKENVLWKTDEENVPDLPKNMKISKWLPQEDILAHPNIKLFITHAGLTSTIETINYGVPVLIVPLTGDQKNNAVRLKELGLGLILPYKDISEEKLDLLLNELLINNTYRQNAKTRSCLLKDRPVKPMDLAVYWVEYVIRHKGASHLRVPGLDLTWYQYLLLDVVIVWSSFLIIVLYLFYVIIKRIIVLFKKEKKQKRS